MSSGDENAPGSRAFDGLTWTEWRSQCYMCDPRDAWVGLSFSRPVLVHCIQLYQWGRRDYKTSQVMLQRWEAGPTGTNTGEWQDTLKGTSMGAEVWEKVSFTLCDEILAPEHGRVVVTNGRF